MASHGSRLQSRFLVACGFVALVLSGALIKGTLFPAMPRGEELSILTAWSKVRPQDIERIELHPIAGSPRAKTVALPVVAANENTIHKVWEALQSQHEIGYYLKSWRHWGSTRYARLMIFTRSGASTSFCLSWDDSAGACEFSIVTKPINHFAPCGSYSKASAALAEALDSLVASNGVTWIPCLSD